MTSPYLRLKIPWLRGLKEEYTKCSSLNMWCPPTFRNWSDPDSLKIKLDPYPQRNPQYCFLFIISESSSGEGEKRKFLLTKNKYADNFRLFSIIVCTNLSVYTCLFCIVFILKFTLYELIFLKIIKLAKDKKLSKSLRKTFLHSLDFWWPLADN